MPLHLAALCFQSTEVEWLGLIFELGQCGSSLISFVLGTQPGAPSTGTPTVSSGKNNAHGVAETALQAPLLPVFGVERGGCRMQESFRK